MWNRFLVPATMLIASLVVADDTVKPVADWREEWAVAGEFSLSKDTSGYSFPTAIAFVPNPGPNPEDPLYFVTEIRGKIKVVTNDRTVHTFAEDFFTLQVRKEMPSRGGEIGMAGICLDPEHGYVFVTFAYQDAQQVLRNNVMRFESVPGTFAIKPGGRLAFTETFAADRSIVSHQIGPCQVDEGHLFVSVGDGEQTVASQRLDTTLGKILRMRLDGKPPTDNPFYVDDDVKRARNYIWSYGMRNPFGLKATHGRLFVGGNGPNVDRFVEIEKGRNYLWDGSAWSYGTNADIVFGPAVSPMQVDYVDDRQWLPAEWSNRFYMALSGHPKQYGAGDRGQKSVIAMEFSFAENRMLSAPVTLVRYRGKGHGMIVGFGAGPDGLYFVPLFPDEMGDTAIMKMAWAPDNAHPYKIEGELAPEFVMLDKGCFGCHGMSASDTDKIGPTLERHALFTRVEAMLNSTEFKQQLTDVDALATDPYPAFKAARQSLRDLQGAEAVRAYIRNKLLEPRFANPQTQMPNLGLSEAEADAITGFLMSDPHEKKDPRPAIVQFLSRVLPEPKHEYIVAAFVLGMLLMLGWCRWRRGGLQNRRPG
jgi:hypothetical protein